MADIQHTNIPSEGCHEPKHISNSVTNDAGKVITPSSTASGESELRRLTSNEIDGLNQFQAAYVVMNAVQSTSKTFPGEGSGSVEMNSMFTIDPSSSESFASVNNQVSVGVAGVYLGLVFLSVPTGGTGDQVNIYYRVNSGDEVFIGEATGGSDFNTTFAVTLEEGDMIQFRGESSQSDSSTVSFAKNITIYKVG